MSAAVLTALFAIDEALARAGVPPMSAYWRGEARRFYEHPTARLLVENVGRGGDKSRTSVKMAIAETVAGDFDIPPGERHFYTHVSENRDEAAKTLSVLEAYLKVLGIGHHRAGDTVDMADSPRGFKVLACRVGAVSGWRCYAWTADECAKWEDEGSDPSAEVITSIKAMTVTHPGARGRVFSSPLASTGFFYETWAQGDTDQQVTGHAPSWVANASITEERTRELEPDPRVHAREYGAQAGAGSSDGVAADDAAAMVRAPAPPALTLGLEVGVLDSSSGRGDGWSFGFARYVRDADRRVLFVSGVDAFEGRFGSDVSFDAVVAHVAGLARARGVARIFGDQYLAFALSSGFAKYGIAYVEKAWTQPTKIEALSTLRRLLRERTLVVEPGSQAELLRKELLTLREVLLPSKVFTVQARRSGRGHADRASLLLMLARAVAEGDVQGAAAGGFGTPGTPSAGYGYGASRLRPIRTAFEAGRGLSTRFEKHDWVGPTDAPPRPDGPTQQAVHNRHTGETTTYTVPQPPSFGPRRGGGRGWGSGFGV